MSTTGAIVVHHANYPIVLRTINLLIDQGIAPHRLVVIDNSEDPAITEQLRDSLPAACTLRTIDNAGYGDAVNVGASALLTNNAHVDYILVSSHETVPANGALPALELALDADTRLGVVGPTLISASDSGARICWSMGGIFTRFLNEPRHAGYMSRLTTMPAGPVVQRAWLDGAFCLYRADVLFSMKFRTDFFLYYEETELHVRMRKRGYTIGWVPSSCVEQSSDGVPPFLLGRNLQLFQLLHGSQSHKLLSVPAVIARRVARRVLGRGQRGEVRAIIRGWMSAWR
jgi:GT2 family glycosyltransferase